MYQRNRVLTIALTAVLTTIASQRAWANCYPSGLKITGTTATTVTVRYVLNEDADGNGGSPGVTIKVKKSSDNSVVRTVTFTGAVTETRKGVHSYVWDKKNDSAVVVPAANYYFEISTLDNGYASWTLISVDDAVDKLNHFGLPRGVAVNKNSTAGNEYFGRVYVSQSNATTTGSGRTMADGVYILNGDFSQTDIPGGSGPKTGGVAWSTVSSLSPWRVEVGSDNLVYMTDDLDAHSGLWVSDADFASATPVLLGSPPLGTGLNDVHGNLLDVLVLGTGAGRKIYSIDEDFIPAGGDTTSLGSILEYDIGTAATTATPPTVLYDDKVAGNKIPNLTRNCIDFGNGSFWTAQLRAGIANEHLASLTEYDAAGAILWESVPALATDSLTDPLRNNQGMAYTEDIAAGGTHKYVACCNTTGNISIVDILAVPRTVSSPIPFGGGNTNNEIAADAAGNIYVINQSAERLRAWSPPTGVNTFATQSAAFSTAAPTISVPPQSQTVCTGANVNFTVTASGTGTLSYQWFRNNLPVGTNSNSLTLVAGTTIFNNDVIRVDVTDLNGTTTSSNAILAIAAITMTQNPYHATVVAGESVSFTVSATTSAISGSLNYQWFKAPSTSLSGAMSPTLTLNNVSSAAAGNYFCRISDICGTLDSAQGILTVLSKPCSNPFADLDGNGIVDLNDFGAFQRCYTGSGGVNFDFGNCACFDRPEPVNTDGDVDSTDLDAFFACAGAAGGHRVIADLNCDGGFSPFADDFDVDHTANWSVNISNSSNSFAEFNFNYGLIGIPSAPHSAGSTTIGLRVRANTTGNLGGGVSVSPTGRHFTGNYTVEFDAWLNYNPPVFQGGSGSTMFTMWGVMTSGVFANYSAAADSLFLAVDGDAGTNDDYRMYGPAGLFATTSGVYAAATDTVANTTRNAGHPYYAQFFGGTAESNGYGPPPGNYAPAAEIAHFATAGWGGSGDIADVGAQGFKWRDVKIVKNGKYVVFYIDGHLITTVDSTGVAVGGDNIMLGQTDFDTGSSSDVNAPEMIFGLIDNLTVTPN